MKKLGERMLNINTSPLPEDTVSSADILMASSSSFWNLISSALTRVFLPSALSASEIFQEIFKKKSLMFLLFHLYEIGETLRIQFLAQERERISIQDILDPLSLKTKRLPKYLLPCVAWVEVYTTTSLLFFFSLDGLG